MLAAMPPITPFVALRLLLVGLHLLHGAGQAGLLFPCSASRGASA